MFNKKDLARRPIAHCWLANVVRRKCLKCQYTPRSTPFQSCYLLFLHQCCQLKLYSVDDNVIIKVTAFEWAVKGLRQISKNENKPEASEECILGHICLHAVIIVLIFLFQVQKDISVDNSSVWFNSIYWSKFLKMAFPVKHKCRRWDLVISCR
jgi:hypothetical protein